MKTVDKRFAIGFDLDGTLWDSLRPVSDSWKRAAQGIPDCGEITDEQIKGVMGLPPLGIATTLFPHMTPERAMEVFAVLTEAEIAHVARVGGTLFDGLEETLAELSHRFPLYIVSNCQKGYIEAFLSYHKLGKYFVDHEDAETTGLTKGQNIRLVMARNGFEESVYVGDTVGDQRAAREAGVPFVFAAYGFGTAEAPETVIHDIRELTRML